MCLSLYVFVQLDVNDHDDEKSPYVVNVAARHINIAHVTHTHNQTYTHTHTATPHNKCVGPGS